MALPLRKWQMPKRKTKTPNDWFFQRALPAPYPASRLTKLNRACFRSTILRACPACDGLGTQFFIDPVAVVPDGGLSLYKGAIAPGRAAPHPITRKHWKHWHAITGSKCQVHGMICPKTLAMSFFTAPAKRSSLSSMMMVCGTIRPAKNLKALFPT